MDDSIAFSLRMRGTVESGPTNLPQVRQWVNRPAYQFVGTGGDSWNSVLGDAITKQNASWELVFRPVDFEGKHCLFNTGGQGTGTSFTLNGSILEFRIRQGNSDERQVIVTTDLASLGTANDFYHVVGVADVESSATGTASLYINGALVDGPVKSTGTLADWSNDNTSELGLGYNVPGDDTFAPDPFNGDIAAFSFFASTLLEESEVEARFERFTATPSLEISAVNYDPAAGEFTLTWHSTAGAFYDIERSTDLKVWTTVQESVPSPDLSTSFSDANLPTPTPRALYYRVRQSGQ